MPWKGENDPYKIWLSEIILQQTRVGQGWAYYDRFISSFPTLSDLATAPDQSVFKCWEGLGYYSRCRNLLATARTILRDHQGIFPNTYEQILSLPGIGPYTAAAITSFAFKLPYAVVDGNVQRVLSRYFGMALPAIKTVEKEIYNKLADSLLDRKSPDIYNQALMDFGATVCKPQNPACASCVLSTDCQAFQKGWTNLLPVKTKKAAKKERWFYYFIVTNPNGDIFIRERTGKDIWKNLFEFILWESGKIIPQEQLQSACPPMLRELFPASDFSIDQVSPLYHQTLTHQQIHGCFVNVSVKKPVSAIEGFISIPAKQLSEFPLPKFISAHVNNPVKLLF